MLLEEEQRSYSAILVYGTLGFSVARLYLAKHLDWNREGLVLSVLTAVTSQYLRIMGNHENSSFGLNQIAHLKTLSFRAGLIHCEQKAMA